ncbi:hypothetical protein [Deinococcus aquatilis]|jgi:hypothetical protein|uniref:hypothetical protein n=1 Tax=Deinococcus aquatilis TaxID=519440 RepID=UPI0012FB76F0|nr:hypothetical protein [Deinococcus aquatilis]
MIKPLMLATILGIASIVIPSPNHVALAGNQCSPSLQINSVCINLVTGWGWPKAFIIDSAAISTLGSMGVDDRFLSIDLLVNIIFYYGVILFIINVIRTK